MDPNQTKYPEPNTNAGPFANTEPPHVETTVFPQQQTSEPEPLQTTQPASVVDKLKAYREANSGNTTVTLPETGVVVSFPKFRSHGAWAHALRMAKNKLDKAQMLYVCKVTTFDGQKLTATDYGKYIPMSDSTELLSHIFGGADDEDDFDGETSEGEDQATSA